jgi:hypothetical protein
MQDWETAPRKRLVFVWFFWFFCLPPPDSFHLHGTTFVNGDYGIGRKEFPVFVSGRHVFVLLLRLEIFHLGPFLLFICFVGAKKNISKLLSDFVEKCTKEMGVAYW